MDQEQKNTKIVYCKMYYMMVRHIHKHDIHKHYHVSVHSKSFPQWFSSYFQHVTLCPDPLINSANTRQSIYILLTDKISLQEDHCLHFN